MRASGLVLSFYSCQQNTDAHIETSFSGWKIESTAFLDKLLRIMKMLIAKEIMETRTSSLTLLSRSLRFSEH